MQYEETVQQDWTKVKKW